MEVLLQNAQCERGLSAVIHLLGGLWALSPFPHQNKLDKKIERKTKLTTCQQQCTNRLLCQCCHNLDFKVYLVQHYNVSIKDHENYFLSKNIYLGPSWLAFYKNTEGAVERVSHLVLLKRCCRLSEDTKKCYCVSHPLGEIFEL